MREDLRRLLESYNIFQVWLSQHKIQQTLLFKTLTRLWGYICAFTWYGQEKSPQKLLRPGLDLQLRHDLPR